MVAAALIFTTALFAFPPYAKAIPSFEEAVIIADGVNMRLRPTVDSPFVLKLENGTRVGVFCEEVDGWYRILYGNYRGYVSKEYVFLPSTDMLVGNVVEDGTPVYMNAGEFSERVDTLNAGMGLAIVSMHGDYYGVEYAGVTAGTASAESRAGDVSTEGAEENMPDEDDGDTEGQLGGAELMNAADDETTEDTTPDPETEEELFAAHSETDPDMKRGYIRKEDVNTSASKNAANMIKEGMKGVEVIKMQRELRGRGFMGESATGEFGEQTKKAVQLFQEFAGLQADGIAGAQTLEMLYGDNDIRCTYAQRMGITGEVKLTPWDDMEDIFYKECIAKVTDVRTGISWREKRFGGWFHADSEPLTAEDTAKMKEAAGGAWTWDRRAIWVTIDGVTYAASMNCMPHLSSTIDGNDFDGHHCIHFYKSKVHETSNQCPRHQAQVQFAYNQGNG